MAKSPPVKRRKVPKTPAARKKIEKVMREFKHRTLHSGRDGRVVTDRKQAIAIALSEARRRKKKKK